jgi:hypothetical protein
MTLFLNVGLPLIFITIMGLICTYWRTRPLKGVSPERLAQMLKD